MPLMQSPPGAYTIIDGRRYLYFAGTSYLGLHGHPQVIAAAAAALQQYGLGSATSRAGLGDTPPTRAVEAAAARLFGLDEAFYFSSGYAAPTILLGGLADSFDLVAIDAAAHYCLRDAARAASLPTIEFAHADADDLRAKLREHISAGQRPLVLSDGVFAATGAIAPVAAILDALEPYRGAGLLLDDAHAVGVLGEHGRGTWEHAGLWSSAINSSSVGKSGDASTQSFVCGTTSKAIGGYGGIIPGSTAFVRAIKQSSRWFDGASAPPPPVAAASAEGIEIVIRQPALRQQLTENVQRMRAGLRSLGLEVAELPTPIVSLAIGDAENMQRVQRQLMEAGVAIGYFRRYSGLGPQGALRIAVFATHTAKMIDALVGELARVL